MADTGPRKQTPADEKAQVTREPFSDEDRELLAEADAVDVIEGEHPVAEEQ